MRGKEIASLRITRAETKELEKILANEYSSQPATGIHTFRFVIWARPPTTINSERHPSATHLASQITSFESNHELQYLENLWPAVRRHAGIADGQ